MSGFRELMESALFDVKQFLIRLRLAGVLLLGLTVAAPLLQADEKSTATPEVKKETGADAKTDAKVDVKFEKKSRPEMATGDREAAIKFAADNHPELARLLEQLQKSRPNEFARAAKELDQQRQLLERVREKNPARYSAQLESWKKDSQIRVLMARWSHSKDPTIEKHVRELLAQRHEARAVQLYADKKRLAEQQRKLDEQIAAAEEPAEAQIDKEWEQLSRKAGSRKDHTKKKANEPAAGTGDVAVPTEGKQKTSEP